MYFLANRQERHCIQCIYIWRRLYLTVDICYLKDAQCHHFDDTRRYFTDYLNFQISVVFLIFQMGRIFISTCSLVQLAGQLSLSQRPHIDGHTVRVQIAAHSTAPFVRNPFSANHVTFQDFIWHGFLEGYNTVTKCCKKNHTCTLSYIVWEFKLVLFFVIWNWKVPCLVL